MPRRGLTSFHLFVNAQTVFQEPSRMAPLNLVHRPMLFASEHLVQR